MRTPDRFKLGHIANSINMTAAEIKAGKINRIERIVKSRLFWSDAINMIQIPLIVPAALKKRDSLRYLS